jgi:DNA-binding CsgD family transcriptional regulator
MLGSRREAALHAQKLSPREAQVLELAARGLTNARVAAELGVSIHAVKFHLASVYRKLGVGNRTEATVAYLRSREPSADGERRSWT